MAMPTEEFPLETPCPVPGAELVASFLTMQPDVCLLAIRQDSVDRSLQLFLTEQNLREIVSLCSGRLIDRMEISDDVMALATTDQTLAFVRDNEHPLIEYVISEGLLDGSDRLLITLIQACVLTTIKLLRSQQ